jgi:nucleotide-binding universal stress UspA family protein
MFKRILVAVDGSPVSNHGLRTALTIAADQDATLYALHVIDDAQLATSSMGMEYASAELVESLWEGLRENGRRILLRAEASARKAKHPLVPILRESRGAPVADAIVRQARKLHADLIVLGTHGRRGFRRLVLGSDAEGVLREARVPVLLVRGRVRVSKAKPASGSANAKRHARPQGVASMAARSSMH